jgi:hypothetical protein
MKKSVIMSLLMCSLLVPAAFCHSNDRDDKTIENCKKSYDEWTWLEWAEERQEKILNMKPKEFYKEEMEWVDGIKAGAKRNATKKNRIIYPALVISSIINGILLERLLKVSYFLCKCKCKKKNDKLDCENNKYTTR